MSARPYIVVDGSNVAFEEQTAGGKPKVSNLVALRRRLEDLGFAPVVIVDASLRHQVDDPDQLEALLDKQAVRQVPAGTDADYFVVEIAEEYGAPVVSNDRFGPYQEAHPWIEARRVPFMIVHGLVQLHEERLEAAMAAAAKAA